MRLLRFGNGKARAPGSWADFTHELERSRRYGRPFGLVRLSHDPSAGRPEPEQESQLLTEITGRIRSLDASWSDASGVFVLLPESERPMAEALVRRLQAELPELLAPVTARVVAFPVDGLTSRSLLEALDSRPLPRPEAATEPAAANGQPVHINGSASGTTRKLVERMRILGRRNGSHPAGAETDSVVPGTSPIELADEGVVGKRAPE